MDRDRLNKFILAGIYALGMTVALFLTYKGKFSDANLRVIFFANVFYVEVLGMTKGKIRSSLLYCFVASGGVLLFFWLVYSQDIDTYVAYLFLLLVDILIFVGWHSILDNKVHRSHKVGIWVGVFAYFCVSAFLLNGDPWRTKAYIAVTIVLLTMVPPGYCLANRKRIVDYMEYKKNIIIVLVVSWMLSLLLYFKFGVAGHAYMAMHLFALFTTVQYVIQNGYLILFFFPEKATVRIILIQVAVFGVALLLKAHTAGVAGLFAAGLVASRDAMTPSGGAGEKRKRRAHRDKLDQLKSEERYHKEIANYLHDSILQDIIFLKRSAEEEALSREELSARLTELIASVREKMDGMTPLVLPSRSLYENLCDGMEQVDRRYKDRAMLVDFFCDEKIYLEEPYDVLAVKIVKELLNNIYKHTESDFAEIGIEASKDGIVIRAVNDAGYFDEEKFRAEARFSGLKQIERTAHLLGGGLSVRNEKGVTVCVTIPIERRRILAHSVSRRP